MDSLKRHPGMADVARVAGVSHQTVSRVLNEPEAVRPSTRERVQAAIAELGYRRNMGARALATSHSSIIGVIVAQGGYSGPAHTSSSIQTAARERGYATLVAAIRDTTQSEVDEVLNLFLDHRVDGMIVIAPQLDLVERLLDSAAQLPQIMIADGATVPPKVHTVSVDQYAAARLATQHLIGLGHRSIGHIRGPQTWFDALERERGWRSALAEAHLEPGPLLEGDWSAESGYQAGRELLEQELPDAMVVANDLMALGLISCLTHAGVSLPEELSIVGHDDIPGSAYFTPALTTVRQPYERLGQACVETLLEAIAGETVAPVRVAPELVLRASTTAAGR